MSELETADSGEIDMVAATEEMSSMFASNEIKEETIPEETPEIETKEVVDTKGVVTEKPEEVEEDLIEMPASWKKERQEQWAKIPKETQEYFIQREDEMKSGLEKDRRDADLGRTMRDVMAPYSKIFKDAGIEEPVAVQRLMNAHYRIAMANPEEKLQLLQQVAQGYGIDLTGEAKTADPAIKAMQDELYGMKQQLSASHEATLQEARTRIQTDVDAFANDHPMFDELADDISKYISAGLELEDAYNSALWANPVTRQKELDRIQKEDEAEALKKEKAEAAEAKKAKSVNIKGRDTEKAPTAKKGKMFDDLDNLYTEIQSREH